MDRVSSRMNEIARGRLFAAITRKFTDFSLVDGNLSTIASDFILVWITWEVDATMCARFFHSLFLNVR